LDRFALPPNHILRTSATEPFFLWNTCSPSLLLSRHEPRLDRPRFHAEPAAGQEGVAEVSVRPNSAAPACPCSCLRPTCPWSRSSRPPPACRRWRSAPARKRALRRPFWLPGGGRRRLLLAGKLAAAAVVHHAGGRLLLALVPPRAHDPRLTRRPRNDSRERVPPPEMAAAVPSSPSAQALG
jgi:hypothetical protein